MLVTLYLKGEGIECQNSSCALGSDFFLRFNTLLGLSKNSRHPQIGEIGFKESFVFTFLLIFFLIFSAKFRVLICDDNKVLCGSLLYYVVVL